MELVTGMCKFLHPVNRISTEPPWLRWIISKSMKTNVQLRHHFSKTRLLRQPSCSLLEDLRSNVPISL